MENDFSSTEKGEIKEEPPGVTARSAANEEGKGHHRTKDGDRKGD